MNYVILEEPRTREENYNWVQGRKIYHVTQVPQRGITTVGERVTMPRDVPEGGDTKEWTLEDIEREINYLKRIGEDWDREKGLSKAKPYTRVRRGKLEKVRGYSGKGKNRIEDLKHQIGNLKSTGEAYKLGSRLTKNKAIELWKEYKSRAFLPDPISLQEMGDRAFVNQMYRETVEGFLGPMDRRSLLPEDIDRRLGLSELKEKPKFVVEPGGNITRPHSQIVGEYTHYKVLDEADKLVKLIKQKRKGQDVDEKISRVLERVGEWKKIKDTSLKEGTSRMGYVKETI